MSAFNGSGTFVISGVGLPYVTATVISSTVANQLNTDLAVGLSNCLTKDGQTVPVANIPMGGFRLTGLGAAVAPGDALSFGSTKTLDLEVQSLFIHHDYNGDTSLRLQNTDPGPLARIFSVWDNGVTQFIITHAGQNFAATNFYNQPNATGIYTTGASLRIGTLNASPLIFGVATAEVARFDGVGNFGIGMTPINRVDILQDLNGTAQCHIYNPNNGASGSSAFVAQAAGGHSLLMRMNALGFGTTGMDLADGGLVYCDGNGGLTLRTGQATPVYFGTNNVERMRIAGAGNVNIGDYVAGDIGKFSVWQSVGSSTGNVMTSRSNVSTDVLLSLQQDVTGLHNMVYFFIAGSLIGSITADNGSVHYNATSDERLKNILAAQRDFGSIIDGIWVGDFEFKSDLGIPRIGVISQQMAPFFPEVISTPDNPDDPQMVDYGAMSPLALWGVKNARSRLADIEARLTAAGIP